jgi:hypothetical protein
MPTTDRERGDQLAKTTRAAVRLPSMPTVGASLRRLTGLENGYPSKEFLPFPIRLVYKRPARVADLCRSKLRKAGSSGLGHSVRRLRPVEDRQHVCPRRATPSRRGPWVVATRCAVSSTHPRSASTDAAERRARARRRRGRRRRSPSPTALWRARGVHQRPAEVLTSTRAIASHRARRWLDQCSVSGVAGAAGSRRRTRRAARLRLTRMALRAPSPTSSLGAGATLERRPSRVDTSSA